MNKKSLFLLPAALLSGVVMADTVSPDEALDKALHFLQSPAQAHGQSSQAKLTLAHTAAANGETYYYVFNNSAGGYVIVAGDDAAHDVLAYGESGKFVYDELPPAMKWFLGEYEHQIHNAIHAVKSNKGIRKAPAEAEVLPEVKPLLKSEWNQDLPYNTMINDSKNEEEELLRYATGCVATSTSQVLRYWGYPKRGMGSRSYQYRGINYEANFAETEYRWDLMQDSYEEEYNGTAEEDAVAQLMHDVGVALLMQYNQLFTPGSATISVAVPYALTTFFGYSRDAKVVSRDPSMPEGYWESLVYSELAEGRPLIYSGVDPNAGGHSFVCDGYKDGRFHINWGWGGSYNDYFVLTSTEAEDVLSPNGTGIGGTNQRSYSQGHDILIGLQPDPECEGYPYFNSCDYNAEQPFEPFKVSLKMYNPTNEDVVMMPVIGFECTSEIGAEMLEQPCNEGLATQYAIYIPAKQEVPVTFEITEDMLEGLIPGAYYDCYIFDYYEAMVNQDPFGMKLLYRLQMHLEGPASASFSIPEAGYRTICLPFTIELDDEDPVRAYEIKNINGNVVTVAQTYLMEAGQGYILVGEPNDSFDLEGEAEVEAGLIEGPLFTANLAPYSQLVIGNYYVISSDEDTNEPRFAPAEQIIIRTNGAALRGDLVDDAYEFLYVVEDEPVGIQTIDEQKYGMIRFNLVGQRASEANGLMIENGRVVFNK